MLHEENMKADIDVSDLVLKKKKKKMENEFQIDEHHFNLLSKKKGKNC